MNAYQNSGRKLGVLKSANESLTRVAVYISLLAVYWLGGNKVKSVRYLSSYYYNCIFLQSVLFKIISAIWVNELLCLFRCEIRLLFLDLFETDE